jgi:hypothetical protein
MAADSADFAEALGREGLRCEKASIGVGVLTDGWDAPRQDGGPGTSAPTCPRSRGDRWYTATSPSPGRRPGRPMKPAGPIGRYQLSLAGEDAAHRLILLICSPSSGFRPRDQRHNRREVFSSHPDRPAPLPGHRHASGHSARSDKARPADSICGRVARVYIRAGFIREWDGPGYLESSRQRCHGGPVAC